MISFKELKTVIIKSCKVQSNSDILDRFSFEVDFSKMEAQLQNVDPNLHVMSYDEVINSYVPNLYDMQMLTEYLHNPTEIKTALNGKTQIVPFMIFSTMGADLKDHSIHDNNNKVIPKEEIFSSLNGTSDNIQRETVKEIMSKLPIYMIVVMRLFDTKQEKFIYKFFFRSNYAMVTYYNSIKNKENELLEGMSGEDESESSVE